MRGSVTDIKADGTGRNNDFYNNPYGPTYVQHDIYFEATSEDTAIFRSEYYSMREGEKMSTPVKETLHIQKGECATMVCMSSYPTPAARVCKAFWEVKPQYMLRK